VGGSGRIPELFITNTILKSSVGCSSTVVSKQWSPKFQSLLSSTGALWTLELSRRFGLAVRGVAAGYAAMEGNRG